MYVSIPDILYMIHIFFQVCYVFCKNLQQFFVNSYSIVNCKVCTLYSVHSTAQLNYQIGFLNLYKNRVKKQVLFCSYK